MNVATVGAEVGVVPQPIGTRPLRPPRRCGNANAALAARLREYAELLEAQQSDGFRVAAYRKAAAVIEPLDRPVAETLATGGLKALESLPAVGRSIAAALAEMITTGRWSQLDRVRGAAQPELLFRTIPGIGAKLAHQIADELHVETLEDLEGAAHDGRLARLDGFGSRRLQMVQAALAQRLVRLPRTPAARATPPRELLLDVDREYRRKAVAGTLPRIVPRRFNPGRRAWLPILHVRRDGWEFTALFSNSALAHRLDRVGDWVLLFYNNGEDPEGQCTVVTQRGGTLRGKRVIRSSEIPAPSGGD
ncbi:helix-hairpin-helix domain-containing protein [soil metagenome]